MHRYDPDSHLFTIRSLADAARTAEYLQVPAILLNEHLIYRRTPRVTTPSPQVSGPDRLVGTTSTPARSIKDLLTDAEIQLYQGSRSVADPLPADFPLADRNVLINAATQRNICEPSDEQAVLQQKAWKLYCVVLSTSEITLWLIHPGNVPDPEAFCYARLQLTDVMIMQLQCSIAGERHFGQNQSKHYAYSEHYACSTCPAIHSSDANSFRVEYRADKISTSHSNADGTTNVYSHSGITYEDSYH